MDEETKQQPEGILAGFRSREGWLKLIVILGLAGVALIFVSSLFRSQNSTSSSDETAAESGVWEDVESYRERLTQELGNMVSSIEGAGRTKLMLTLDGTIRSIYATDSDIQTRESSSGSEKKSYVVVRRKDGTEQALTIGQLMPVVKGVLVLCEGGNDEGVVKQIQAAVAAAVRLSTSHICVLKLSV